VRVLCDTNVLVSYLLTARPDSAVSTIMSAAFAPAFTMLVSAQLPDELIEVTRANRYLAQRISPESVAELVVALRSIAEEIPVITEAIPAIARDPKDDYLLAYALVGRADYLVTGDYDILALGEIEGLQIVSPADFARLLGVPE
jgi:putative PIN family toxin of toxin-antitoxin system